MKNLRFILPLMLAAGVVWILVNCITDAIPENKTSTNSVTGLTRQGSMVKSVAESNTVGHKSAIRTLSPTRLNESNHTMTVVLALSEKPAYDVLKNLRFSDQPTLIAEYRRRTNLTARVALTWSLGYIGDADVLSLFRFTLEKEFSGRRLNQEENAVMDNTVAAIGLLARRHDTAYQFLTNATDVHFWKGKISWKTIDTADAVGSLAGTAIAGLGLSGRADARRLIEEMEHWPLRNELDDSPEGRTEEGAVMTAIFYLSYIRDKGMETFDRYYFDNNDAIPSNSPMRVWRQTPEGQHWYKWYRARSGHPAP